MRMGTQKNKIKSYEKIIKGKHPLHPHPRRDGSWARALWGGGSAAPPGCWETWGGACGPWAQAVQGCDCDRLGDGLVVRVPEMWPEVVATFWPTVPDTNWPVFFFLCLVKSCSFAELCPTLYDPMDCRMPGFPVPHHLLESAQTHVHWVGDTIQPSHPLSPPSPPAFRLPQHQGLFPVNWLFVSGGQRTGASDSASVLPMNIQGWFPLGLTGLISLLSKGLSGVFFSTTSQKHQFLGAQPSLWFNSHICTWLLEKP